MGTGLYRWLKVPDTCRGTRSTGQSGSCSGCASREDMTIRLSVRQRSSGRRRSHRPSARSSPVLVTRIICTSDTTPHVRGANAGTCCGGETRSQVAPGLYLSSCEAQPASALPLQAGTLHPLHEYSQGHLNRLMHRERRPPHYHNPDRRRHRRFGRNPSLPHRDTRPSSAFACRPTPSRPGRNCS